MMAPRRRRVCSGNRKWKRRCTWIRRDERGWHACAATDLDRSQCRFGLHLRLSLLIRVNLSFHFLASGRYTGKVWRRNAKLIRCVARSRRVRRTLCPHVSAGQDGSLCSRIIRANYRADQRVIGLPIEISSRFGMIRRVSNPEVRRAQRGSKYGLRPPQHVWQSVVTLITARSAIRSFSGSSAPLPLR